jgi:hypothetical protein
MRRDFLLELSDGFVYQCLRWQLAASTWPSTAGWSWSASPARCASMGRTWASAPWCWPPAPLADLPVGFALGVAH